MTNEYDLPDDFVPMSLEEVAEIEAEYITKLLTFYDIRKRVYVAVEKAKVTKFTFKPHNAPLRYGLRGELADGWKAHKFIDENAWRFLDIPFDDTAPPPPAHDASASSARGREDVRT